MALTYSNMMELGTKAPNFKLLDTVSKNICSLDDLKSDKATVIMFICNHCPFVHHLNTALVQVANSYQKKGVQFIAISSNDVQTHPEDSPERMVEVTKELQYPFPYLYDESQDVAKSYKAVCTPDFFVFDKELKCSYRGRFDDTRPNMGVPTGKDLTQALDALLNGEKTSENQFPSMGCNIKWK